MDQVQLFKFCHLDHLARQCRSIEGKFKQGIGGHLYLVVEDIVHEPVQPHRHSVTDEMNLMAPFRQRFA